MPAIYNVNWSESARSDLESVLIHIACDHPQEALRQLEKIEKQAQRLNRFPERGRVIPELKEHGIGLYRELIINPWRLIYRVSKKKVHVLCFLDSRRNIEDLLLERLIG